MKWTVPNLRNIPVEISSSNQICLWKYEFQKNSNKYQKKPYHYIKSSKTLAPGINELTRRHLLSLDEFLYLRSTYSISSLFSAGFYLQGAGLSVIDIDNYQTHPKLDSIIADLHQKGCYIEVSPSGKGLHIFYKGIYDWSYRRNKCIKVIQGEKKITTCEIYNSNDKRFITLTGQSLKSENQSFSVLPMASDIAVDLLELKALFFAQEDCRQKGSISEMSDVFLLNPKSVEYLEPYLIELYKKIMNSQYNIKFGELSSITNPGYSSTSEVDMAFLGLGAMFLDKTIDPSQQSLLLFMFFERYRPKRPKTFNRVEYIFRTIQIALNNVNKCIAKENKECVKKKENIVREVVNRTTSKDSTIKICNNMKIFHFGRSIKEFTYISNKDGNRLEAHIPESLNQSDFRYFMQLLFMYIESTKPFVKQLNSLDSLDKVS